MKVQVGERNVYYSDVGVTCDVLPDDAVVVDAPHVVAEVSSPGTRAYDLIDKRAAYRKVAWRTTSASRSETVR